MMISLASGRAHGI